MARMTRWLVAGLLAAAVVSTAAARSAERSADISPRGQDGRVLIELPRGERIRSVSVEAAPASASQDRHRVRVRGRSAVITGLDPDRRYRYQVRASSGRQWRAYDRFLPFDKANNFRDIGGYVTNDGAVTRWNALYRSDQLNALSDDDLRQLSTLAPSRIYDLRSAPERARAPDRLPADMTGKLVLHEIPVPSSRETALRVQQGRGTPADVAALKEAVYSTVPVDQAAPIGRLIQDMVAAPPGPVALHCTLGRDRTGIAVAVILRLLGVDREQIVRDYMLSEMGSQAIKELLPPQLTPDVAAAVTRMSPNHIEQVFDSIDRRYGSFDTYVRQGLRLSPGDVQALKARLLEPERKSTKETGR